MDTQDLLPTLGKANDVAHVDAAAHAAVLNLVATGTLRRDDRFETIRDILDICRDYFSLPVAMVARRDGDDCVVAEGLDESGRFRRGASYALAGSFCEEVMRLGETRMIHDVGETAFADAPGYQPGEEDVYVGACLTMGGEIVGTLNLAGPAARERGFTTADRQVLETAAALASQQMALADARTRFDLVVDGAQLGLWEWNIRSDAFTVSAGLHRILNLAPDTGPATFSALKEWIHYDDREAFRAALTAHFEQDAGFDVECRLVLDGRPLWVRIRGKASRDRFGRPDRMAGTIEDISRRVARDALVERQAHELRSANEELRRFAFMASHDLQAPLRKIIMFGEKLEADHGRALGPDGLDYLGRMTGAAGRMRRLVSDLLRYATTSNASLSRRAVSLEALIERVRADLSDAIEEAEASLVADDLPMIEGDPDLLYSLFTNLVGNALKYRGEATPRIEITARRDGDDWEIRVRDNGIGFPPDKADQIFLMFQRLQSGGAASGSGIGLALCQRIVERHGGRISAEGRPGEGACFTIRLPMRVLA